MREAYVDVIRVMLATAPHDTKVAEQEREFRARRRPAIRSSAAAPMSTGSMVNAACRPKWSASVPSR